MLEILKAIFLGIVEGITEWLPISSTGHMILVDEFLKLKVSDDFMTMFLVVIQLGAIMAVVLLYWKKIFPFRFKGGFRYSKKILNLWVKILVACVPAAIVGVLFDDIFDKYLYNPLVVATMLILVGIAFIVIENLYKNKRPVVTSVREISIKDALIIGVFQLIAAIFPGTSRSGSTILGGLMIGVSRPVAAEFTFYLAVPVMVGASLLKILKYIIKVGFTMTGLEVAVLIVGMVVAFFVSIFTIKFLLGYIKKHDFKVFGWYRIALGAVVIGYWVSKTFLA